MRALATVFLGLLAGTASAVPVSITANGYSWYSDNIVGAGTPDSYSPGDAISVGHNSDYYYDNIRTSEYGSARALTHGHVEQLQFGTDETFFYQFDVHVHALASVDASIPEGNLTLAKAEIGIWLMGVQFEVTEPVLFTGTGPLYGPEVHMFDTSASTVSSGTYLQPGRYSSFYFRALEAEAAWVQPGQTVSISNVFSNTFHFASVPTPATLPLLGFSILAIACRRRRRSVS